jgi:hypothetical protein
MHSKEGLTEISTWCNNLFIIINNSTRFGHLYAHLQEYYVVYVLYYRMWRWALGVVAEVLRSRCVVLCTVHQVGISRQFHIWCTDTHTSNKEGCSLHATPYIPLCLTPVTLFKIKVLTAEELDSGWRFYNTLNNRSEFAGKLLLSYYFLLQNPYLQLLNKKSTSVIRDFISPGRKYDTEI